MLLNAGAQLLLKAGTNVLGVITLTARQLAGTVRAHGARAAHRRRLACYVVSVVVWIIGLSRVPVSIAYPLLSLGYIVNAIAAHYLFGEAVTLSRWLGIGFIIVGVWLVARVVMPRATSSSPARCSTRRRSRASASAALRADRQRPWVQTFEAALSAFCGGRPVRVLTSATAAVEVALQLCRHRARRRGDHLGAELLHRAQHDRQGRRDAGVRRLRSGHPQHRSAARSKRRITPRTRAIMPTHYPGSLVDMDALLALARRAALRVIEDAALVIGSRWKGRNVGAFGDLTTFSFHPNKNITSIEGGALVVNDEAEAKRVEALRFHGITYLPDRTRDVAVSRRQVQPARRQCAHRLRAARATAGVPRAAPRAGRALFRALRHRPACVLPPVPRTAADDGHSWNMFCVLLPLDRH